MLQCIFNAFSTYLLCRVFANRVTNAFREYEKYFSRFQLYAQAYVRLQTLGPWEGNSFSQARKTLCSELFYEKNFTLNGSTR